MIQAESPALDRLARPLRSLRISVTDRCNLRCRYCMPEEDYAWLPRGEILTFEEIDALAGVFAGLGVDKFRLTGGEPLLRRDLPQLVRMLAHRSGVRDLALTTNGVLLDEQAAGLAAAGLQRLTISLDTLRRDRFAAIAGRDFLDRTLAGVRAAAAARLSPLKFNAVIVRGLNDDELCDLIEFARSAGGEMRFIEYMDVGGATRWSMGEVVTRDQMLAAIGERYGGVQPLPANDRAPAASDRASAASGRAPAECYALPDGTRFGIIASTTAPFCRDCERSRLTADGHWFTCLYALDGLNLRDALRGGATPEQLTQLIRARWSARTDRGAEDRLAQRDRGPFVPLESLRTNTHLEMHTRGG